MVQSDIGNRQNKQEMLSLLKARQWQWLIAARWQWAQLTISIILPFLSVLVGLYSADTKPFISFFAVIWTTLDVAWIDRQYRNALKVAARCSESFDTALFRLEWNSLAVGRQPSPEQLNRATSRWEQTGKDSELNNWYSSSVDAVDLCLARAICQRTNLSYDSDLRNLYVRLLTITASSIVLFVIFAGMFSSSQFADFVIAGWVPAAPFAIWALRERFRQVDAVEANAPILAEAEALLGQIIEGRCSEEECATKSRRLQDAIFARRASTTLLFPGIYRLRREDAERDMHASAKYWLEKAGKITNG